MTTNNELAEVLNLIADFLVVDSQKIAVSFFINGLEFEVYYKLTSPFPLYTIEVIQKKLLGAKYILCELKLNNGSPSYKGCIPHHVGTTIAIVILRILWWINTLC